MAVSREEVVRIARLAHLRPDEGAIDRLTGELNGILEHIRRLEEADVSGVEETGSGPATGAPFRDPGLAPDALAAGGPARGAPAWQDGFFVVPRLPAVDGGAAG